MLDKLKKIAKVDKMMQNLFTLLCLSIFTLLSISISFADTILYLKGDGVPIASLSPYVPTASTLPNYDTDRNSFPGLLLARGGNCMLETNPTKYQIWAASPGAVSFDGPISLIVWSAMKDFNIGKRGIVDAFLLECDSSASSCSLIAQAHKDLSDWSGGSSTWVVHSLDFGNVTYSIPAERSLAVKIVVGNDSYDDMWFAYDTSLFPSKLTDHSPLSDIVIDGDFSEWCNGIGTDFCIDDQGGPNDWASPAKLDITRFAFSSNLVDSFYILMGFDDVPPQSTIAAALIDTDLNNNIDFALVATLDGSDSTVEMYSCDDTVTDGCEGAVLYKTYPQSYFCTGDAMGPWDNDFFMESILPFSDLSVSAGDTVAQTSLVSYAAATLLKAPKDSIFGTDSQNYFDRILYDTSTGTGTLIVPVGSSSFIIRRDTDPSSVRGASAHANVPIAPYDDLPGSLQDDASYFYVVEKDGSLPVKLSVHSNVVDNAVRLGFDDNNPLSASVDSTLSTVSSDTSSIPADASAAATVTVIPRDSNDLLIGSGCEVSIDEIQLSPGTLIGTVKDNFDGSYTFKVVSNSPASGYAVVIVEGIVLDSQPMITFVDGTPEPASQNQSQNIDNSNNTNNTDNANSANMDSHNDYSKVHRVRFRR